MEPVTLGFGTTETFFSSEFELLNLNDKRLHKRTLAIFKALQSRLTTCVRRLFLSEKDVRQAYDFFSNPKVSKKALLDPHIQNTVKRIEATEADYILAIQDSTLLNYTSHKAKTEIGRIGRSGKTDQYGLIQHSTLCVTDTNEPLGLLDLQHFHGDEFETHIEHQERQIEDKQTQCWISALHNMRTRLKGSGKKIITIADREGDFFEFLHHFYHHNESFVIRAKYNRRTGNNYSQRSHKLFDLLRQEKGLGEITVTINDVQTHEIKDIQLTIKRLENIALPLPRMVKRKSTTAYEPIHVNAVMAYNDAYCWILLTDLPVEQLQACEHVIKLYKSRWHIEDYHKILKTGYQIEEIYLHASRKAIENALTMASISACRLYWLIYVGRVEQTIKADQLFKAYEWKALYIYFSEKIPEASPSLSDIITKIAKLGGYKPKKNIKPPGIKTMWLGFQKFMVAAEMYQKTILIQT